MKNRTKRKSLLDGYQLPGFRTGARLKGRFSDRNALVICLSRRQKKHFAAYAERHISPSTISTSNRREISARVDAEFTWSLNNGASIAKPAAL